MNTFPNSDFIPISLNFSIDNSNSELIPSQLNAPVMLKKESRNVGGEGKATVNRHTGLLSIQKNALGK